MSISTVPSCGASAPQSTATSVVPITAPRPRCAESAEDDGERQGHHREGGSLRAALAEAFHGLGIDLPVRSERSHRHEGHHHGHHEDGHDDDDRAELPPPVATTPAPAGNEVGIPAIDPAEDVIPVTRVTARTVRSDLHDFMHALFDAARSAFASASAVAASPDGTNVAAAPVAAPGGRLAIGLSALVSQVGAGQTPPGLQGAFDQLMSDLSAWRATGTPSATADAAAPTLQQLLGALQQRLGYGSSANDVSALGNTVDLAA
jgi:hypothetical protein